VVTHDVEVIVGNLIVLSLVDRCCVRPCGHVGCHNEYPSLNR